MLRQMGTESADIAVIGAGIAGCSAAKFLRDRFGKNAHIVVFERDNRIGGRIRKVSIGGVTFEAGGKLIHKRNRYFDSFVKEFDLNRRPATEFKDRRTGIWNGDSFQFQTSRQKYVTSAKLLWRYGLSSYRTRRHINEAVKQFQQIYQCVESGFKNTQELLEVVDLKSLANQSGCEYLRQNDIDMRFIREFVSGATRVIYGQEADMNAVACLTSLAGMGGKGSVYTLRAPNAKLCRLLLEDAEADLRTETPVKRITTNRSNQPQPTLITSTDTETFDAVCIATPYETADLDISGIDPPEGLGEREFIDYTVSFIEGKLDPTFFDIDSISGMPELVITGGKDN